MQLVTDKMIAEKKNNIGWMTFNNTEHRNAISYEMRLAILEILEDFQTDDKVRVIVMKGAGDKAFVSGSDISQFAKRRATEAQKKEYSELLERVQQNMASVNKPMIAMIQGYYLGAGLGMALNADIRIASEDAQFGVPVARLGHGYSYRGTKVLVDLVGSTYTKEILFTGRRFTAGEALQMGLINRVVHREKLEETVRELAATIAENAPLTIRATKACVWEALKDLDLRDLALCERLINACTASQDYIEGQNAFMEKRRPVFVGR